MAQENTKLYFDRQIRIEGWNQDILEKEVALCLGVGGLGSVVLLNLLRLGVKKIFLVDYDKVDSHNLNRQIMYKKDDIGKYKVDAALENAKFHNINNSELIGLNINALTNWQKIVELVKSSTIIFNMIDVGDYFDAAVQSLCIKLQKPLIIAGTFCQQLSCDYYFPGGKPCYLCQTDNIKQEIAEKLVPSKITEYQDISFIPRNDNPVGQSNVFLCSTCSNFMVSLYINKLFKDEVAKDVGRFIFYINSFEVIKFECQPRENCLFCQQK